MNANSVRGLVRSPWSAGVAGMLGMAGLYATVVTLLSGSAGHTWEQFLRYRWWMLAMFLAFGIQVGIVRLLALRRHNAMGQAAVAGGTGSVAMAACCAHHALDFLPFIGGTLVAGFVVRAQAPLLAVGVASNLAGIAVLLGRLWGVPWRRWLAVRRSRTGGLRSLASLVYAGGGALAVVIAAASFGLLGISAGPVESPTARLADIQRPTRNDAQASIEVSVSPLQLDQLGVRFAVGLETHTVELDYDFAALSSLTVDRRTYAAQRWEGGRGGHHLSGILVFPPLPPQARTVVLTMNGVGGVVRKFDWSVTP